MNYRSTLMTAGAAVALAGLATAQANGDYDHNWASLANGPAALLLDPQFFGDDGDLGLGDSIRLCYSIDVTQGGRNASDATGGTGRSYISWFDVAQGFGGANLELGVNIGQVSLMSRTSDSLNDDACLSDIFLTEGNAFIGVAGGVEDVNLGAPGLIAGTGGYSITAGFFWDIAFEFIGSNLPSLNNTAGLDPVNPFGSPMLTHLVYEIQGPVDGGDTNRQYFLGSTSERNGVSSPGGVTNGNANFGSFQYGVTADLSGAVQGNRVTIESGGVLTGAGAVGLLGGLGGELEFLSAVAFQTPYLTGVNSGNAGGGGADWVLSGGTLSTIDIRIIDKLSGGQAPASGASIENPGLFVNNGFLLWSSTPAVGMLQTPLSWDDVTGAAPPKAGSYLPDQTTARAGAQPLGANFDGTTSAFLSLGISFLSPFGGAQDPNLDPAGVTDLFDVNPTTAGVSSLATGPIAISSPATGAAGARLGLTSFGVQVDSLVGALTFTEFSNSRTAVLQ